MDVEKMSVKILLDADLKNHLKQFEFLKLVRQPKVLEDLTFGIYERDPGRIKDY